MDMQYEREVERKSRCRLTCQREYWNYVRTANVAVFGLDYNYNVRRENLISFFFINYIWN